MDRAGDSVVLAVLARSSEVGFRRSTVLKYLHTMVRVTDLDARWTSIAPSWGWWRSRRIENAAGRFTLVFLCAPDDEDGRQGRSAPRWSS